jgi:general secretion pathway protein K
VKNPVHVIKNERGVALLVAIFALMLMIFIATEVSYDTSVEYIVARQQVNRLKAYYSARSGVEMSLLRILVYKKAIAGINQALGAGAAQTQQALLDQIWRMPFAWPPSLPDSITGTDRDTINQAVKESPMDGQYVATIDAEGGRIDINDLWSTSKQLRESTRKQLLRIFTTEVENNEAFSKKNRDARFEELVNNMVDWVDEDTESLNGGDEKSKYEISSDFIPPNAPFKTTKEINRVAGMTEEFYQMLINRVTLFGTKGINVNYAPREVIASLDPSINERALEAILKRRSDPKEGGPFQNEDDFFKFAQYWGVNVEAIQKSGILLSFGSEYNFRIRSTGIFGNVKREITAITFDLDNLRGRYITLLDKEAQNPDGKNPKAPPPDPKQPPTGPTANDNKIVAPKGRPTVVYWEEN